MDNEALYGKGKYGSAYYGDELAIVGTAHNTYRGRRIGHKVRGQIGRRLIYRVRQGNGYAGSIVGRDYQDRFVYFVPSTIEHPNGDAARSCFAAACAAWKALPLATKKAYNRRASRHYQMKGHNLFIREYMKEHY